MAAYNFATSPSRSRIMSAIRSKDTKPEKLVRSLLRELGFPGYRLHRRDIPGTPDIAYIGRRKAIFVNGCFWHGHHCKASQKAPKTNQQYWLPKIRRTRQRDRAAGEQLKALGWHVLIVWECELPDASNLSNRLLLFMDQK